MYTVQKFKNVDMFFLSKKSTVSSNEDNINQK